MQGADLKLYEKTSHGKPGFGMVVYKNDFSTYFHQRIPWHWHEEIEFVVVTKGIVEISVSGGCFTISEGNGIFLNANALHYMKPATEENAYMFSVLIHPGMLSGEKGYLLKTDYVEPYLTDHDVPFKTLSCDVQKEQTILSLLKKVDFVFFEKSVGYEYHLFSIVIEIWYHCMNTFWKEKPYGLDKYDFDHQRIYQAMQFIQEHYADTVTLDDICWAASVSRSECCRCFGRNLNMSPVAYLTSIRISHAAELLRNTERSLTDIAISSGFNDDSYFCKIFKKQIGCTPLSYRKQKEQIKNKKI